MLITVELLFTLVLLLGIASAVSQPARLALIPTLIDRESLPSALAINSVIFNLARFIGPAIAGVVIADIGIAAAFAANAVSYIAFQISLARLRGLPALPVIARQGAIRASVEAYAYASRHPGIGPMLLLFAGDDDRHARFCRAVPRLCRQRFRARPARPVDADLDGRARRDLRRRLDGAAPGGLRPRRGRARPHLDDVAGDPGLYRDRPVLVSPCPASLSPARR